MNFKGPSLLIICLLIVTLSWAQTPTYTSSGKSVSSARNNKKESKGFDRDKLIIGGGLGLAFGNITSINVAPVVGYRITDRYAAGIGIGYQYYNEKNYYALSDPNSGIPRYYPYRASIYSAGVWNRFLVFKNLFVQAEYEHNFMSFTEYRNTFNFNTQLYEIEKRKLNYNAPSVLAGLGLRVPVTDRVSMVVLGMYDVLQHEYSPYRNRIVMRIGVNVGF